MLYEWEGSIPSDSGTNWSHDEWAIVLDVDKEAPFWLVDLDLNIGYRRGNHAAICWNIDIGKKFDREKAAEIRTMLDQFDQFANAVEEARTKLHAAFEGYELDDSAFVEDSKSEEI